MAAVGIVSLAIASAANLRTALVSFRQRCEHLSDNEKEFDELLNSLVRITENLRECEHKLNSRSRDEGSGIVFRNLTTVNEHLVTCRKILEKLAKGLLQAHSQQSCLRIACKCWGIARANRIHGNLSAVSAKLRYSDELVGTVATLLEIPESSPAHVSSQRVDRHRGIYCVPRLTDQEVLRFDGEDENSKPTPEAQLKIHLLDRHSKRVTAAAGDTSGRRHGSVHGAHGMAGVGKTIALKGLGWDKEIREAFDEIYYITLGHDATADTVVSELARIVEMSGGQRQSCTVRGCTDVRDAVTRTSSWFSRRNCLFLVDDVWKTAHNRYGYLPILRELLSGCEGSRIVITTRDKNIAGEVRQSVQFGSRGSVTSRQMFFGYFGSDISESSSLLANSEESVEKILSMCSGLPLALGIAGRGARALKDEGRSAGLALRVYASRLEQQRSKLIEEPLPGYGGDDESLNLRAAIETSLDFLDSRNEITGTSCDMRICEMYRGLGVLKAQAWAPLSMLSKLWNVGREDAESIMGQLCTMSLAKREDCTSKAIRSGKERTEGGLRIHDLQLEYCQLSCNEMGGWHGKLLNGYLEAAVEQTTTQGSVDEDAILGVELRPWWSESVAEDGYVHENVAWHLVKAGKRDELRSLLVDARWIRLRLEIGGIVSLENDFAELICVKDDGAVGGEGSATESSDSEFRVILNALRCSWQYALQNERELAVQLGGRLFDVQGSSSSARKLVESAIKNSQRPFAEARYGFLPDARSGQVNEAHLGRHCESLAYSDCGKYILAAVGLDFVVLEAHTLSEKIRVKDHMRAVSSFCVLPQSSKIVFGVMGDTLRLWDLSKPDDDAITLKGHTDLGWNTVWSVCASGDGSRVASGSGDGTVRLWHLQKEAIEGEEKRRRSKWSDWFSCSAAYECQVLRGHASKINDACFSSDGALLASASDDRTVRLWNGHTGEHTGVTIKGHEEIASCVAIGPDGERVASGSVDATIRLWRADTGAPLGIVIDGHSGWVKSVAFSADGARIVSASDDKTVRVWSAESGAAMSAALKGHTRSVTSALFCPDGERVASVSEDGTLRIWEPERAGEVGAAFEGYPHYITCATLSADGTRTAIGYLDGVIVMWDTQSGRTVCPPFIGHTSAVECVAFSPDGLLLASGSNDKTVKLFIVRLEGALGYTMKGHDHDMTTALLFSADGSTLLSRSCRNDSRCLWSVTAGTLLWTHQSTQDAANVLSDAEAQRTVEAIESQSSPDPLNGTAAVYHDFEDSALKMKCSEGCVRLASLPPLAWSRSENLWMHIADRNEFVAVLTDGRPVRLKLHV